MGSAKLEAKTVAFLTAQEGVEEVELTEPWKAVQEAGDAPKLIAPDNGEVQAFNHLDKGSTYRVEESLEDADPDRYDALVLPGGVANPDQLRMEERATRFVQRIFSARQARRRDLPRTLDARGGRPRA
jgi:deglycase